MAARRQTPLRRSRRNGICIAQRLEGLPRRRWANKADRKVIQAAACASMALFSRCLEELKPLPAIGGEIILMPQQWNVQRLHKNFINRSSEMLAVAERLMVCGAHSSHPLHFFTTPLNRISTFLPSVSLLSVSFLALRGID
jgi:hypothetical protein